MASVFADLTSDDPDKVIKAFLNLRETVFNEILQATDDHGYRRAWHSVDVLLRDELNRFMAGDEAALRGMQHIAQEVVGYLPP